MGFGGGHATSMAGGNRAKDKTLPASNDCAVAVSGPMPTGPRTTAESRRVSQQKPGRPDECGSDVCIEKRAKAVGGSGGYFCDHPGRYPAFGGQRYAGLAANTWAISARGFNSEFEDKLLVL